MGASKTATVVLQQGRCNHLPDYTIMIETRVRVIMLLFGQELNGSVCLKRPQLVQQSSVE